jgi:hypothetical protein
MRSLHLLSQPLQLRLIQARPQHRPYRLRKRRARNGRNLRCDILERAI